MTMLRWLQNWYSLHCDGQWELSHGIAIQTNNDPLWYVTIDLPGNYKDRDSVIIELSEHEWHEYQICDNQFYGSAGLLSLFDLLTAFEELVSSDKINDTEKENDVTWLGAWFKSKCNGDWEYAKAITILTTIEPGWQVDIELSDEKIKSQQETSLEKSEKDWWQYKIDTQTFSASGGVASLSNLMMIAKNHIELSI